MLFISCFVLSNVPHLTVKLRNDVRELRRSAARDDRQEYVAEGLHLAQEIQRTSTRPSVVIYREDAAQDVMDVVERFASSGTDVVVCSPKNMDLMTDASTPQAILCVVPYHAERPLQDRVLVLDAVADPGNVGTMIRTAAWFGFSDVVLGLGCADLYNSKVIRSTAGAALHINVVRKRRLVEWFSSMDDRPRFAAVPRGGSPPETLEGHDQFAVIVGSEAHGISNDLLAISSHQITIPGSGSVESLNAAMAAAILCYAGRRR